MKKPLLTILSLSALMVLASCGSTSYTVPDPVEPSEPEEPYKPYVVPTEIMLNSYCESLYIGETFQIEPLLTSLMSSDAGLTFESSNSACASVNEFGLVTAKQEGSTNITVKSEDDEEVFATIKINVFEEIAKTDQTLKLNFAKMKAYQKNYVDKNPAKLKTKQVKSYSLYKNDELFSISTQYNNIAYSTSDALVYFGGRDTFQRIQDGTITRDFGAYQITTDKDYHSYIFHDGDAASRYCYVPTEFNLGTENSRMDTVYSILDSLFNSGRDLVLDTVEDSLGTEWLDRSPTSGMYLKGGYRGDTDLVSSYTQAIKSKSTPLMEQNLDIPAYIEYEENDSFRVHWYKGEVQAFYVNYNLTYYVNGVKHTLSIEERDSFYRGSAADLEMPDQSKYSKVKDIFEL